MFDIRLRLMGDNGTTKRAVLPTLDIDVTQVDSSTPTISFAVSEKIAGRMDAPQVVAVEYSMGGPYVQPRNGLFMVSADNADDADTEGTVRFTGQGYVPWFLGRTYLHWSQYAVNGERLWTETGHPASAGTIMGGMLGESQVRGWGASISTDFTWNLDSAGVAWTADEKVLQPWRLLTPLSSVLASITDQGLCDWWAEGAKLRLFRPGAGETKANIVLGGPAFGSRPTKSSFDDVFTHLTVVPEKADNWLYLTNTGASTRFGRLEATLTQSGVADHATATTLAQTALVGGRAVKREYSFDWTPASGGPIPWDQFNVGDIVTSKTRHGKSLQRVIGIQVSKSPTVTVRVIVGDKLLTLAAKTTKRAASATIGGTIGGGGASFPIPDATFPDPSAPTGLHVVSSTALWRADGTAQSTVTLGWSAVSQADDGSAVDVRGYEVAQRTAESESVVFATTEALETTTSEWAPSVARFVKVRAVAFDGSTSAWSTEISVTPIMPSSIIPKAPTGLAAASNTGAFQSDGSALSTVAVTWVAVTQSLDNLPVDIAEYEFSVGMDTQRVTGPTATFTVPSGKTVAVKAKARTTIGVWGDPSTTLNVVGAVPVALLAAPTAPILTTGQGIVFATWGGNLVSGTPPVGFQHVVAELALAAAGPWTRAGSPIPKGGGGVSIRGVARQTVWVRFTGIDTLGRPGTIGASASIVVKAVEVGDIDHAITDAIAEATSKSNNAWDTASVAVTDAAAAQTKADAAKAAADAANAALASSLGNGGFEADFLGWTGATNITITTAAGEVFNGSKAAALSGTAGTQIFSEAVATEAGRTWMLRAKVKTIGVPGGGFRMQRYTGSAWVAMGGTDFPDAPDWTTVSQEQTTPAGTTKVRARFATLAGGPSWIDDVELVDVTDARAAQSAANAAQSTANAAQAAAGNAQTTANAAQLTASSKTTTYRATTAPSGVGNTTGDTWEQWTSLAAGGRVLSFWNWDGSAWIKGTLDETYLPLVNIGSGTYGSLAGGRLTANSISTKQLLVTSFENLVMDPSFEYASTDAWTIYPNASFAAIGPRTGTNALRCATAAAAYLSARSNAIFSVAAGEQYRVSAWVRTQSGVSAGSGIALRMAYGPSETSVGITTGDVATTPVGTGVTYVKISGIYTASATAKFARLEIVLRDTSGPSYLVDDIEVFKMAAGELIVDGTLKARHVDVVEFFANTAVINQATVNILKAGVIQVDMLAPNVGNQLVIDGNLTIISTRNQAAADSANAQATADAAQATATTAVGKADVADGKADVAQGAAGAAQDTADDAAAAIALQRVYYNFGPTGQVIGDPATGSDMRLHPNGLQIRQNGVSYASFENGVLIANQVQAESAQIANHKWEKTGTGRSTLRML